MWWCWFTGEELKRCVVFFERFSSPVHLVGSKCLLMFCQKSAGGRAKSPACVRIVKFIFKAFYDGGTERGSKRLSGWKRRLADERH